MTIKQRTENREQKELPVMKTNLLNKTKGKDQVKVIELLPEPSRNPYFNPFLRMWIIDSHGLCYFKHSFLEFSLPGEELLAGFLTSINIMAREIFNGKTNSIQFNWDINLLLICKNYGKFSIVSLINDKYHNQWYVSQVMQYFANQFSTNFSLLLGKEGGLLDENDFAEFHKVIDAWFLRPASTSTSSSVKKIQSQQTNKISAYFSKFFAKRKPQPQLKPQPILAPTPH